ncbi:hypothetical protein KAU18_02985 [Candidatus Bathyarchaeota archaeon]|nr:hypothetical protein [Candidatus Bathyarchaeota archaeon]
MKTKLVALTLLLMLLMAPITQVAYAEDTVVEETGDGAGDGSEGETGDSEDGDEGGNGNIDPLVYQQIKQDTNTRYEQLFNLVFGQTDDVEEGDDETGDSEEGADEEGSYDGLEIPEDADAALRNQFIHAWMAMQQAEEMEGENLQAAAQQNLRAMKMLRNALRKYQKDNPEALDELEPEEAPNIDDLPEEPTLEDLEETQQQLVVRFQERFHASLIQMFHHYNEVEGELSPGDAVKVYNALIHAEQKLLRIQERIHSEDLEGVIDDLEDTINGLEDDYDDMEDHDSAQMLKTVNKLWMKIEKMLERKAWKEANGIDTSDEDDLINQFKGNIDKVKNEHKENKGKGNNGNNGNG